MSHLQPDQKYLRVRNISSQDLYLADIDDEENFEENEHIQTYISSGEYADLPMNNNVVESYEQGTIRGFIDSGDMAAAPHEGVSAELWVGPQGSDDNPGTKNNPLASIQTAIDRLTAEFGDPVRKRVNLKSGTYIEQVDITHPNVSIIGEKLGGLSDGFTPKIIPPDGTKPPITITNLTQSSLDQFRDDGGVQFSYDGSGTFSWDGPDVTDREVEYGVDSYGRLKAFAGVTLKNLFIHSGGVTFDQEQGLMLVLGAPGPDYDEIRFGGVEMNRVRVDARDISSDIASLYLKNTSRLAFNGFACNNFGQGRLVHDNCILTKVGQAEESLSPSSGAAIYTDSMLVRANGSSGVRSTEGHPFLGDSLFNGFEDLQGMIEISDIDVVGDGQFLGDTPHKLFTETADFDSWSNSGEGLNVATGDTGSPKIVTNNWASHGSGAYYAETLEALNSFSHDGSGTLDISRLQVKGAASISGGSGHLIRGGTVDGDLVLESGATGAIRGLTVKGDVIIRDASTQFDFEGCHVQGSVTIDTDTTDQTQNFYGGHIIGEGNTNEVRDPEGNDVSANADWNRVSGV